MYKENGRLEPADKSEYADAKSKQMVCDKCGSFGYYKELSFGERITCPSDECGGQMIEDV